MSHVMMSYRIVITTEEFCCWKEKKRFSYCILLIKECDIYRFYNTFLIVFLGGFIDISRVVGTTTISHSFKLPAERTNKRTNVCGHWFCTVLDATKTGIVPA